jgi:hypothetical protein
VPGALPSSTTAPVVAWRQHADFASVFLRSIDWIPAPPRVRAVR